MLLNSPKRIFFFFFWKKQCPVYLCSWSLGLSAPRLVTGKTIQSRQILKVRTLPIHLLLCWVADVGRRHCPRVGSGVHLWQEATEGLCLPRLSSVWWGVLLGHHPHWQDFLAQARSELQVQLLCPGPSLGSTWDAGCGLIPDSQVEPNSSATSHTQLVKKETRPRFQLHSGKRPLRLGHTS